MALAATAAPAGEELSARQRAEDFDALWQAIDQGYAYFGTSRHDWRRARDSWRRQAIEARTRAQFVRALEGALARLHDDHVGLTESAADSPRRVPAETDIWAGWRDGAAIVEGVRTFGDADVAGLRPGQVVRSVDGLPVGRRVLDRLAGGEARGEAARDWALRHVLAGPRDGSLRLETDEARGPQALSVERHAPAPTNGPPIVGRRMGIDRDLGYVRIRAPLSAEGLVARFDAALTFLSGTRGLILDLRDVSGPFADPRRARAACLAILGRFTARPAPWQARQPRSGLREVDTVAPRGLAYTAPLVVLVDRWTAGEGEALAAGLQSVAGARLVGTRMAGLHGELADVRLPNSGIGLYFPAARAFRVDGTPREALRPDVLVDLAAPQGGPGDPILYLGLKQLER